ncbi:sirohydrochlorin chelatase [Streptomyces sp. NPDC059017]|uniref:sirohydrochlorin chelatase n=1 Tax=unclassified Streptomyces TaxID=2593676 RepID=UPI0034159341
MTESAHPRESLTPNPLPLDSTAQLLTRITAQLGAQLSHVQLNGVRRPMSSPSLSSAVAGDPCTAPAVNGAAGAAPVLVAVAHGSRDPRALRTVTRLLDRVRELRPAADVRLGHIELDEPLLPDTLAGLGGRDAVLVPLLLGRGFHVKHDIPAAVAAVPGLRARVAPPLGPHPLLVEALHDRLVEAGWCGPEDGGRGAGVVLAAAGSRDPASAADARSTAAMLAERLGGVPVLPAYASAVSPTVPEALRALTARGRHQVAVASYFTAPGRFATASRSAAPWIAAAPLGAHPALARLVLQRYDEARTALYAPTDPRRLVTV